MHHPDLIAAVQGEALRCHGLVLGVDDAARALRFVQDPGPHVAARRLGPEHEAAEAALRWWRIEHEFDRPGVRAVRGIPARQACKCPTLDRR